MFNTISLCIFGVLLATTSSFGYLSYKFYGDVKTAEANLVVINLQLESAKEASKLLVNSCAITEATSAVREGKDIASEDKFASIKEGVTILENKIVKKIHKEQAIDKENSDSADDVAMQRLLDDAYCESARSSSYCTSRQ